MQVKKKPKKTAKAVPEKSRKKKQPSEDQIKKQPFLKRMLFGEEKPDLSELEAGSTTILDILSPTTVDTKSRDYIIVDDVYHAYLYITGYGYTTTVGTCWLAPLVEAGEGINLSFLVNYRHADPYPEPAGERCFRYRRRYGYQYADTQPA